MAFSTTHEVGSEVAFTRAHLIAGNQSIVLPVNPYSAQWQYTDNISSMDTIGGRVVQLLSVQLTDLTITSVAGSRRDLQKVADGIREIMQYHIRTSLPAKFVVPSRAWRFSVFIRAMPQVGWDVAATTYPYQLQLALVEDIDGVKTREVTQAALTRLAEGIGYNPAVHGGDVPGFTQLVDTVLKLAPDRIVQDGSNNNDLGGNGGTGGGSVDVGNGTLGELMVKASQDSRAQRAGVKREWATDPDLYNVILSHESGASANSKGEAIKHAAHAQNPTSTAFGIFQFLDSTWAGTGISKTTDPYLQCVAGLIYIKRHWGNLINAVQHKKSTGWY